MGGGGCGGGKIENEKAAIYTSKLRLNASPPSPPKLGGSGGDEEEEEREREREIQTGESMYIHVASVYCTATCDNSREVFSKSRSTYPPPPPCPLYSRKLTNAPGLIRD